MKISDDRMLFSASDLMRFLGCAHATTLDLLQLCDVATLPDPPAPARAEPRGQAAICERIFPEGPHSAGRVIIALSQSEPVDDSQVTREALTRGADLVSQGALFSGSWGGYADELHLVPGPPGRPGFSYEVALHIAGATASAEDVLRVILLSDILGEEQDYLPEFAHLLSPDASHHCLRVSDYIHYLRLARDRFEAFLAEAQITRPRPCSACANCSWNKDCRAQLAREDSLYSLPQISRAQVRRLEAAGITSASALARHEGPVRGLAETTRASLSASARLREAGPGPAYELRPPLSGRGFDLLPRPSPGDLFYQPATQAGVVTQHLLQTADQQHRFDAGESRDEAGAFIGFLAHLRAHYTDWPEARLYYFGAADLAALRGCAIRHGIGEALLDRLAREQRLVDLAKVLRGAVISPEPCLSPSGLARLWGKDPEAAATDPTAAAMQLRDWLIDIRPEAPWPAPLAAAAEKEAAEEEDRLGLRALLEGSGLPPERQALLFNLGLFHQREVKPAQWAVFDSTSREEEALLEDLDCLAGLVATGPAEPFKRSLLRSYRFPPQESKLRAGKKATVPVAGAAPAAVTIHELDRRARRVTLKVGAGKEALLADQLSLHPDWPIDSKVIAEALRDVIADQCGPRRYRAVDDLLSRRPPRLSSGPLSRPEDLVGDTIAAITAMEESLLPVQGPPGTGKTYVTARAMLALLRSGARIGVSSNSHEAIRNLMLGCLSAMEAEDLPVSFDLIHKTSGEEDGYPEGCAVRRTGSNDEAAAGPHVVGATAWFFARDENIQAFDWLFVDEAGQVGLANMAAMGRAARNIVLVGDPRQLPQVIQGSHPEPAGLSCLDWLLGDQVTIPPSRGILLPLSRRMHPAICSYISEQVYESRLTSHPEAARQAISGTRFPEAGVFWCPVAHEGNAQIAPEEISAIAAAVDELLRGSWRNKEGRLRSLRPSDIIVVAPYNAQVNALRDALPGQVRVGTVDKFQGQEAPVCLISMTASSAGESARGMEFLLSLNRINVAVSRAKALALVFGAPGLREAPCDTPAQMRLVNTFCALPTPGAEDKAGAGSQLS